MQNGKTMEDDKEKYDEEEIESCEHDSAYYFERAVARKRKKKLKSICIVEEIQMTE